jgi:hypothetical protein
MPLLLFPGRAIILKITHFGGAAIALWSFSRVPVGTYYIDQSSFGVRTTFLNSRKERVALAPKFARGAGLCWLYYYGIAHSRILKHLTQVVAGL